MKDLRKRLANAIRLLTPGEGFHPSPVSGVTCLKIYKPDLRTKRRWRACLAIVAQGEKEIVLGRGVYRIGAGDYSAAPVELPVVSRFAAASMEKPFLGLLVDLDPRILGEVAAELEKDLLGRPVRRQRALFIGAASERMLEAAARIVELARTPEDAGVLGPLAIRELIYHLLRGPNGPGVYQFVRSGSKTHRVHQAIYALRAQLGDEVDVDALARGASMSRSAFFKHFKEVTAVSPIQYRKRLRLLEARRLMADEMETAEGAAFRVGYKSASQFSREYSRMFGNAPRRDVESLKRPQGVVGSLLVEKI
jgi:AraC-like DNA-binding protein